MEDITRSRIRYSTYKSKTLVIWWSRVVQGSSHLVVSQWLRHKEANHIDGGWTLNGDHSLVLKLLKLSLHQLSRHDDPKRTTLLLILH